MAGLIGYHTSTNGGYSNAAIQAKNLGLDTFQFFLSSPRSWKYKEINQTETKEFKQIVKKNSLYPTSVHLKYLINPCTPKSDQELQSKSKISFHQEILRCDMLGIDNLIFHIGSHKGRGFDKAKFEIANFINDGLILKPNVNLILENSAGQRNAVGSNFEEIGLILELCETKTKIGVCLDTCHTFGAGYDISKEEGIEKTLQEFDDNIGLKYLKVIHMNDSKGNLGSGLDRHENIGKGTIGKEAFKILINHEKLDGLPFILETPAKHLDADISLLKSFIDK